ncbi:hypothetical protein GGF50DRAFT_122306 [Schizophyllum commune]
MLAACTPQRLSLATPPPAPKKGASLAYIGNQADECEFRQVESLYQKMSRTHISSALPVTPPSKSSSYAATGRGNQAKLNSSPLAGEPQSSPIAKQYQPQPSTPANKNTGKREHSKPQIMKDSQGIVLVDSSDDDSDDEYKPTKEEEEKDDEETSDESTEEDVATEPEDNGGANEPSGSGNQNNAMDAPPMASTSTSASTSRSPGLPGRFPIGYGRTQSPPLTGKRSSQDGPLEETSESKRIKSNDMDMSGPEPVSRQPSMSTVPAPSISGFARHATTSNLFQNSNGFGTSTPSSQSSSTPSPFTRTSSAPNPFGNTNSGFGAFSGAQPHAAPTPTPSSQWIGASNQATQATPSPSAPTTQPAARSPAPNAFTSAFASSADAFGMRRSAPSQPASTGQSGNSSMNPVNNINTSLTVSSLQPTPSVTQPSHVGQSLQLQPISTNFSMQSASPASAPPQQPPRDFMQESLMCHANAYSALKAFDDAVAAAHAPILSASQPATSLSRSTTVVRPLAHSVSLPPSQPQSCLVQKLIQRHSTRTAPTLALQSSSSLLSGSRSGAVFNPLGSPRKQRSEGSSSPLKTEGSNAWMWSSETSRRIFEEERRLTIEDDKRRARKDAERARRKEEERELRRIERAAEKEALRKQRKRELKAREAEEAEERRMAAFPVPAFMYFEEQRRKEKKRAEKEARRAARKAAAAAEESGETSLPGTWHEDEEEEEEDSSAASSTTSDESVGSVSLSSEGGSDGPSDCELAPGWGSRLRSALSWALPLATS